MKSIKIGWNLFESTKVKKSKLPEIQTMKSNLLLVEKGLIDKANDIVKPYCGKFILFNKIAEMQAELLAMGVYIDIPTEEQFGHTVRLTWYYEGHPVYNSLCKYQIFTDDSGSYLNMLMKFI